MQERGEAREKREGLLREKGLSVNHGFPQRARVIASGQGEREAEVGTEVRKRETA